MRVIEELVDCWSTHCRPSGRVRVLPGGSALSGLSTSPRLASRVTLLPCVLGARHTTSDLFDLTDEGYMGALVETVTGCISHGWSLTSASGPLNTRPDEPTNRRQLLAQYRNQLSLWFSQHFSVRHLDSLRGGGVGFLPAQADSGSLDKVCVR
jgi:hypothetical protein